MSRPRCLSAAVLICSSLVAGCRHEVAQRGGDRSIELLVRREAAEVWTQGNLATIPEIFADTTIAHYGDQSVATSHADMRSMVGTWRAAFPDLQMAVEDIVVSGDKAAARYAVSGTHLGELWGNAPTGRRFRFEQIYFVRVASGRIVETWGVWDEYGLRRQLGLAPRVQ